MGVGAYQLPVNEPFNVFPVAFVRNTDPATTWGSLVGPGRLWIQTENDADPWGDVLGVFVRNADNSAWLPFNVATAAPTGAAGGSLSGTYPNPAIATDVALPGNPTTTTQSSSDDSTKVATTAFVQALFTALRA